MAHEVERKRLLADTIATYLEFVGAEPGKELTEEHGASAAHVFGMMDAVRLMFCEPLVPDCRDIDDIDWFYAVKDWVEEWRTR